MQILLRRFKYESMHRVYSNTVLPRVRAELSESNLDTWVTDAVVDGDNWRLTLRPTRSPTENAFQQFQDDGTPFLMPTDEIILLIVERQVVLSGMATPLFPELPDGYSLSVITPTWAVEEAGSNGLGVPAMIGIVVGVIVISLLLLGGMLQLLSSRKMRRKSRARARVQEAVRKTPFSTNTIAGSRWCCIP